MIIDAATLKAPIKPKADSTLNNMRKADLIEYIRCLEHNYNAAVWFNENQARYIEQLGIEGTSVIKAEPARPGRWIERLDGDGEFVHHMCSECKADAIFQYIIEDDLDEGMDGEWYSRGKITTGIEEYLTNCCPNCGRKLTKEAEK